MTQRQLVIIKQLLTDYYRVLATKGDYRTADHRRLIEKSLKAIESEQQENRNTHLVDTFKSWARNTWRYLLCK